jgi:hypothetical protein
MRIFALVLATLTFAATSLASGVVSSRSIMDSCQFVYRVESDVRVSADEETLESVPAERRLYLRAQATNSWDREPVLSEVFLVPADDVGLAAWSFESMSVSKGHLFRDLRFEWGTLNDDDEFVPLGARFLSDVGRRFGEACSTWRGPEIPFVEREVSEVQDEEALTSGSLNP